MKKLPLILTLLFCALRGYSTVDSSRIISTIMGGDSIGYWGDGGPAKHAGMRRPFDITNDKYDNLFFIDFENALIRKIDTNGIVTCVAGGGSTSILSLHNDTLRATTLMLAQMNGLCVDKNNNILFTSVDDHGVYRLTTDGYIYRIAGGFGAGFNGDSIPARLAKLNYPTDIESDNIGNIYFSDLSGYRLRKIDTNGIIYTIGGNGNRVGYIEGGSATGSGLRPTGFCLGKNGEIYVCDSFFIRKIDSNGIVTTYAGSGSARCFAGAGNVATVSFGYPGSGTGISNIWDLNIDDSGVIWGANQGCNNIMELKADGTVQTFSSTDTIGAFHTDLGDGRDWSGALFYDPISTIRAHNGKIYIAGYGNNRIRCVGCGYHPELVQEMSHREAGTISILPNPIINNTLSFTYSGEGDFEYSLTSLDGRMLFCDKGKPRNNVQHPLYAQPGVYMLTVTSTDGHVSAKVIIE